MRFRKFKENFATAILISLLLVGLSLVLYPTVSDYWNSFHQSKAVASYLEDVEDMEESKKDSLREEARVYNEKLPQNVTPSLQVSGYDKALYNETFKVSKSGIMAYIEIPKLNTTLPIYHGTDETVLQVAIGHIPGTSFPIGGKGSHAVVSGHRGLPSARLFTDIDHLVEGDIFLIQVLDETLTYQVDQILTVLPQEVSALRVDPDQDYVTLTTCTPYGINTHRLLVRGHRVANLKGDVRVVSEASQVEVLLIAPFIAILIFVVILLVIVVYRKWRQ
ncbi:class C sortase [Streptococcus ruminicola]|uniref:class C sortase n=1 Tax=Streptococcus ruminicola TaxID=2686210 RepID=UPI0024140501|nr:class C sortase [Streptococcus ruminicola]WFM81747.1 class C sortase [Streptococcus ruminicola]